MRGGVALADQEMPAVPTNGAEERVKEALEKAEHARRTRQYQQGIDILLDALQYKAQVDMVFYRLGNIYFDSGDLARAEYAYRRAIETNPHHVNAHHNLSVVYKKTGRIHDSVRMRKRAARLEAGGLIGRTLAGSTPPTFAKPSHGELPDSFAYPPPGQAERSLDQSGSEQRSSEQHGSEQRVSSQSSPKDEPQSDGSGVGGERDKASLEAPLADTWDPVRDDPEGFRRFGARVALAGMLVFFAVAILFLAAVYFIGYWIF